MRDRGGGLCRENETPAAARAGRASTTWWRLASLAVGLVLATLAAELRELHAVRGVAAVLARDVVAVLALCARERDLRTNVILSHGSNPCLVVHARAC